MIASRSLRKFYYFQFVSPLFPKVLEFIAMPIYPVRQNLGCFTNINLFAMFALRMVYKVFAGTVSFCC